MSPTRFLREFVIMVCTVIGTLVGYAAGSGAEPTVQMCLAFLGMALAGAAAEFCLTR